MHATCVVTGGDMHGPVMNSGVGGGYMSGGSGSAGSAGQSCCRQQPNEQSMQR